MSTRSLPSLFFSLVGKLSGKQHGAVSPTTQDDLRPLVDARVYEIVILHHLRLPSVAPRGVGRDGRGWNTLEKKEKETKSQASARDGHEEKRRLRDRKKHRVYDAGL